MANWYLGTMGFSYKDWIGHFYPNDIVSKKYLEYYSQVFNSVEVDSTFYGIPKAQTINIWTSSVPDEFKFCVKVPRRITHDLGLINGKELMGEFLYMMSGFKEKLGVILLQFPPSFRSNQLSNLSQFLSDLPLDFRYAIEIRHLSWYTEPQPFSHMLSDLKIAWVASDFPNLPAQIVPTSSFIYIRWIGKHGSFSSYTSEKIDRIQDLMKWWEKIQPVVDQSKEIFGFFNDDYSGFAPGTTLRFKNIVGIPHQSNRYPRQDRLF
jgi:uncharacterized protein YecE (DUF72 family)